MPIQYVVNTSGRLLLGYGKEQPQNGVTLFHDAANGLVLVDNQVSLGAGETSMAKERFEQRLWGLVTSEICQLHSDNGIFNAEIFVEDCKNKFQTQSFLELVITIRILLLSGQIKLSCT